MSSKRIGILTSGGDCPGLNAVIRGTYKAATQLGYECLGFLKGYEGLYSPVNYITLDRKNTTGILNEGGTILGSTNKGRFAATVGVQDRVELDPELLEGVSQTVQQLGIEGLVCVGGDGSLAVAQQFREYGIPVVGVPKTIDNDLMETDLTFGFDTARTTATDAVDRLHDTAQSHHRVMIVEVMGRNAGWLALESGLAGGGDVILLPEVPYDLDEIAGAVRKRSRFGKRFSIIVASEGCAPRGGDQVVQRIEEGDSFEPKRLGGVGKIIAEDLEAATGIDCRVTILGHLQRGGSPTPFDRVLATRFSVEAMEMVIRRQFNHMVALKGNAMAAVPIEKVMGQQRKVPLDSDLIRAALAVGTSFGTRDLQ